MKTHTWKIAFLILCGIVIAGISLCVGAFLMFAWMLGGGA